MKTAKFLPLALALALGIAACTETNDDASITDSTAPGAEMMDSVQGIPPASGMGPATGGQTGGATSSANDSIVRMGGGATSRGDTSR